MSSGRTVAVSVNAGKSIRIYIAYVTLGPTLPPLRSTRRARA